MKLWKRTVLLMLVTLLCALIPVGALSIYVTGNRRLNNAAETYGRQLENGKTLLEQFWDNSKYEQMSETGKKATTTGCFFDTLAASFRKRSNSS